MALALLELAKHEAGGGLEAFELIDALGMDLVVRHIPNMRRPLEGRHEWFVLMEIASEEPGAAERIIERVLTAALERELIEDAALAQTETQAKAFWNLRENQSAGQKAEGPAWKNDISVPVSCIPEFIDRAGDAMRAFSPGVRIPTFGHVGDGNLHYDLLAPEGGDVTAHMAKKEEAAAIVNRIVASLGGSISAEHGVGVMKVSEALLYKEPAQIAALRAIRASLDPLKIMNPRVLF
jgi:FAD/FMN-containing dehydrogenase